MPRQVLRRRVHRLLEAEGDLWAGHAFTRVIVAVILVNLTAICLESVPAFPQTGALLARYSIPV